MPESKFIITEREKSAGFDYNSARDTMISRGTKNGGNKSREKRLKKNEIFMSNLDI